MLCTFIWAKFGEFSVSFRHENTFTIKYDTNKPSSCIYFRWTFNQILQLCNVTVHWCNSGSIFHNHFVMSISKCQNIVDMTYTPHCSTKYFLPWSVIDNKYKVLEFTSQFLHWDKISDFPLWMVYSTRT